MWLINTTTFLLTEFFDLKPRYAILSHRWGRPDEELSFKEYRKSQKQDTSGYEKIITFCRLARDRGLEWAWVDTCCIDKRSSAELSESINSMYSWYEDAEACCVYLNDASSDDWRASKWWCRGWTLQELIAPSEVLFFDKDWQMINNKKGMAFEIAMLTGIPAPVLENARSHMDWTVAQRMAWAAHRHTTRLEDRAYSLLGLFKVNMPLLYGEGNKAFQRLQIEILQKYPDESIFAWQHMDQKYDMPDSVLAKSPDNFVNCLHMEARIGYVSTDDASRQRATPPRVTSWGIELRATGRRLKARRSIGARLTTNAWAITLTEALHRQIQELPCTIVLAQSGPRPYNFQRYECFHGEYADALSDLTKHYIVGKAEENKLFYLWFDTDIVV